LVLAQEGEEEGEDGEVSCNYQKWLKNHNWSSIFFPQKKQVGVENIMSLKSATWKQKIKNNGGQGDV
jgi:hypothetical protein